MNTLLKRLKEKSIFFAVLVILISVLLTSFIAIQNQFIMRDTQAKVLNTEYCLKKTNDLLRWLNLVDLGVRGYALGKTEGLLDPFNQAIVGSPLDIDTMRNILRTEQYPTEEFETFANAVTQYMNFSKQMIELVDTQDMEQFKANMIEDRGFEVWKTFQTFSGGFISHQRSLAHNAEQRYARAVRINLTFQIILLVLGLPSLLWIFFRLQQQDKTMRRLLMDLDKNNRQYTFDPGTPLIYDTEVILNSSIQNSQHASHFIKEITSGNFNVTWPGLDERVAKLNQKNLSGLITEMRNRMKDLQDEDHKRIWTTEGLTQFNELIRKYQDNAAMLADYATRFLVRYLNAQQGGAFLLQEDEEEKPYLELSACYAFDKKKIIEKRIAIGDGVIGQAHLEGSTITLKAVPQGYTHITSGLGEATPSCVLIVPMTYNEKVEGVLELAGFKVWNEHEIQFAEKATAYMAASISSVRATQKMRTLVEQMQSQTQQLHAQEEEMRQNMEELAATNEEMKRKESEYLLRHTEQVPLSM